LATVSLSTPLVAFAFLGEVFFGEVSSFSSGGLKSAAGVDLTSTS